MTFAATRRVFWADSACVILSLQLHPQFGMQQKCTLWLILVISFDVMDKKINVCTTETYHSLKCLFFFISLNGET